MRTQRTHRAEEKAATAAVKASPADPGTRLFRDLMVHGVFRVERGDAAAYNRADYLLEAPQPCLFWRCGRSVTRHGRLPQDGR